MKAVKFGFLKLGMILVILAVILMIPVMTAAAVETTLFSVLAPDYPVTPGDQFNVTIQVQPGDALAGVQLDFAFDPSLVAVDSIAEGDLLNQGNADTFFDPGEIDNTRGTVTGVMGAINTPGQTVSESGSLAIITLTSLASGNSDLSITSAIAGSINGQPLPVSIENSRIIANETPFLDAGGDRTVNENELLAFTVNAQDPDGDSLTYSAANLPQGATFNSATGTFTWTPAVDQAGLYPDIRFTVSDGITEAGAAITISVLDVNQPPVLNAIVDQTVKEGEVLTFTVNGSDPDGDSLTYSAANLPSGASFDPATRTFTWTPAYDQAGTYSNLTFRLSDGEITVVQALTITVVEANQAPVLDPIGDKTSKAAARLTFQISATDPDSTRLTYTATNLPKGATFKASTRTFNWTPSKSQVGTFSNIRFQVSDGKLTDYETITIIITGPNKAPVITKLTNQTIKTGELVTVTVQATDANNDPLTYTATNLPAGAVFDSDTHVFSWTPASYQTGTFRSIRFYVTDGTVKVSKTMSITVKAASTSTKTTTTSGSTNRAPTLYSISNKTVRAGRTLTFTITGKDLDKDALTYSASNLPAGATFNPDTRRFTWAPTSNQVGVYRDIVFTVSDGSLSSSRTIRITVVR